MHLEAPQGQQGGVLGCSSFVSAQEPTHESFQVRFFFFFSFKMRPVLLSSVGGGAEYSSFKGKMSYTIIGTAFFFCRLWDLNFQTRVEPGPLAVKAQIPNDWPTRGFPGLVLNEHVYLPGVPVVKNLLPMEGTWGSIPGLGRSLRLRSK